MFQNFTFTSKPKKEKKNDETKIKKNEENKKEIKKNLFSIDDFELLKVVGKGPKGKVLQVRKKDPKKSHWRRN